MNSPDDDARFIEGVLFWFVLAVAIAVIVAVAVGEGHAAEVSYRNGGGVTLSATPTPIGNAVGRIDISAHNDADSIDDVYCGYNPTTLSATPGPSSGDKWNPGEGDHICQFADHILYCMTLGSAKVYWDESRMVTPTPTP